MPWGRNGKMPSHAIMAALIARRLPQTRVASDKLGIAKPRKGMTGGAGSGILRDSLNRPVRGGTYLAKNAQRP